MRAPVPASASGSQTGRKRPSESAIGQRGAIREVVLRCNGDRLEQRLLLYALSYLRRELAFDGILARATQSLPDVTIALGDWQHQEASLGGYDRLIENVRRQGDFCLVLSSRDWLEGVQSAFEVLNRFQRLLPLPAGYEPMPKLNGVLAVHRLLHQSQQGRAPHALTTALDAWRWTLRLNARPSVALQLAALFHDATGGQESSVPDEAWQRDDLVLQNVRLACQALEPLSLPAPVTLGMAELLVRRDEPDVKGEPAMLRDALDLAFFGTGSARYLAVHGTARTYSKVAHCLSRMSSEASCLALMTRQPPLISDMIEAVLGHD
jgi:hypothetical protein